MEEGGCGMRFVIDMYIWLLFFFLGWFLFASGAEEGRFKLRKALVAVFFAVIWPVTILAYIGIKLSDRRNRK